MNNLKLSIVIPTLGREKYLLDTVADLTKQNFDKSEWECIIVYQGELNFKLFDQFINDGFNIRFYFCNEKNANLARNIGIKNAKAEIVILLDDDVRIFETNFLNNYLISYDKVEVNCVCGQVLSPPNQIEYKILNPKSFHPRYGWFYFRPQYYKSFHTRSSSSNNLSFKKRLAIEIGGFDENFSGGAFREESEFCLRYTDKFGNFYYNPLCSLMHLGAPTGGARNIKDVELNHTFGEWYFVFAGIRAQTILLNELPFYVYKIFRNRVFNQNNLNFIKMIKSLYNLITGLILALIKFIEGPKYIKF